MNQIFKIVKFVHYRRIVQRVLPLIILLLPVLMLSKVNAAIVEDLYTVELAVADQTTTQRLEVFKQAFGDVIMKVSGSSSVLGGPGFRRPLMNSSRYVHQFRYLTRKDENADEFDSGQLILRVTFNQEMVENLLRENTVPIWGRERPSTLFLISYEVNKSASIVSSDTVTEIVDELDKSAVRQGLPILFPLLDLEDRMQIGVQDIIDGKEENINVVSARYAPDALLVGRIIGQTGKGWQGQWQVRLADKIFKWDYNSAARENVMNQAVSQLSKTLAAEYALVAYKSSEQDVLLMVDQVVELKDQVKLQSYLQSLEAIESARLIHINQDNATYKIIMHNTTNDLTRLISLGNVIEQVDLPQIDAATDDQTIIMSYRLIH